MPVRVFMVSRDPDAVHPGSATATRIAGYAALGAEVTVAFASPSRFLQVLWHGLRMVRRGWVVTAQDPFEAGKLAWIIARLRGARLELQMHGDFFNRAWAAESWHRPLRLVLARFLLRRADGVRTVSARVARSLQGIIPADRITIIPVAHRSPIVRGEPINWQEIRFDGRLAIEKNLPMLVRAFAQVRKRFPGALLRIRGSGPQQKVIEDEIKRVIGQENIDYAHVERPIVIQGWTDDASVDTAGIIVIPSNHESWSRLAIEAARAGRAVVMTDVGCAGEIIINRETGWVVPPGDENAFANALMEAISHPGEAQKRGQAARALAEKLPSGSDISNMIVAAWEKLARA